MPETATPTKTSWVISVKKPLVPQGCRKIKFCTGGYKKTILGKTVESVNPVWAEERYDKKEPIESERTYYRLYTYTNV